jgi:hypothetical protein
MRLFSKCPLDLLDHIMAGLLDHIYILDQGLRRVTIMQEVIPGKLTVYPRKRDTM